MYFDLTGWTVVPRSRQIFRYPRRETRSDGNRTLEHYVPMPTCSDADSGITSLALWGYGYAAQTTVL